MQLASQFLPFIANILCFCALLLVMAPPNDPSDSIFSTLKLDQSFHLSAGKLTVKGVPLLSDVPSNVSFTPYSVSQSSDAPLSILRRVRAHSHDGGFLGFRSDEPSDRITNSLGRFSGRDFLSVFRFKTWWSTMWVGKSGSDLQMETQWILLNIPEIESYVLILPIIEGRFRSALHGGSDGQIVICAESGSKHVKASSFEAIAYVHVSDNPYRIMKEAFSALRVHLNTFRLLEEKKVPNLVDKFGWCTWDAFYLTVEPIGVSAGVDEFVNAGVTPRFVIIDDGWQSINFDGEDPNRDAKNLVIGGTQMTARLYKFQECDKFRKYKSGSILDHGKDRFFDAQRPKKLISKAIEIEHAEKELEGAVRSENYNSGLILSLKLKIESLKRELDLMFGDQNDRNVGLECEEIGGLRAFTEDLRKKCRGLDDIYVWHALCGAWGGVRPGSSHMNDLDAKVVPCKVSPGLVGTMDDLAVIKICEGGIGLVCPDKTREFYDSMHSYLAQAGVTGVKVDVIHTLEYICEDYGGRVELAKAYYKGLNESLVKNFNGSGLISSMQQCNDFFFLGARQISMGRVGDDFWFQDPNGDPMGVYWLQGVHMIHCAYNSLWMGQMIHPDWDMFQSDHICAKFHAGSRAICGGPVYVSDNVGGHDLDLIKKLVFPDGTIPKCHQFALPTRDCLFTNPLFDNKTILKIWNFNKFGGVVGAFNCQGAGWDPKERRIKGHSECYKPMNGEIRVHDIEWDQTLEEEAEEYAVHMNQGNNLLLVTPKTELSISLEPSTFEIFSFVPIKKLKNGNAEEVKFAPIGLTNMFNSGGTIREFKYDVVGDNKINICVEIKVKGGGCFLAYSNVAPNKCCLDGVEVGFGYDGDEAKLSFDLPWIQDNGGISHIKLLF